MLTVRARPGVPTQGLMNVGDGVVFPCALGRGGISADKREGDGATPLAAMRLLSGYLRGRRFAHRLEAAARANHSHARLVRGARRPQLQPAGAEYPIGASHETMLRTDGLYDACIVLDWNISPRRRGRGSADLLPPGPSGLHADRRLRRRDAQCHGAAVAAPVAADGAEGAQIGIGGCRIISADVNCPGAASPCRGERPGRSPASRTRRCPGDRPRCRANSGPTVR